MHRCLLRSSTSVLLRSAAPSAAAGRLPETPGALPTCAAPMRRHPAPRRESTDATAQTPASQESYFFTSTADPTQQDERHRGRLYRVPADLVGYDPSWDAAPLQKFRFTLFPREYTARCDVFEEAVLMVRRPALEIFDVLRTVDVGKMDRPVKFVLWGRTGQGKTMTLSHVLHYLYCSDFVAVNFDNMKYWLNKHFDIEKSDRKPGTYDHLVDSQMFLKQFKAFNRSKLDHLKNHKTYVWSIREKTDEGSPVMSLVDHGIERPKFAADALGCLMRELRLHASERNCKVATVIDGANSLYLPHSLVHKDNRTNRPKRYTYDWLDGLLPTEAFTVVRAMRAMVSGEYGSSAVVATADAASDFALKEDVKLSRWWTSREKKMRPDLRPHTPFALLRQEGWEAFDPFIPVEVPALDDGELDVMIDYYIEKGYLKSDAGSEMGRREIRFLTGGNAADFFDYSALW